MFVAQKSGVFDPRFDSRVPNDLNSEHYKRAIDVMMLESEN